MNDNNFVSFLGMFIPKNVPTQRYVLVECSKEQ